MNNFFVCPLCQSDLVDNNDLLVCRHQHQFPVIDEIVYFLPLHQNESFTVEQITQLKSTLDPQRYTHYVHLKRMRNMLEPYALFQPFNESFQSLLSFINAIKKKLKPGDIILDSWCRTGFSGDFLAGMFPQQTIISIWEGNNSVLGYQGFHHFFNPMQKHKNHQIIFHDCNKPLPFKDDTFAFVYSYDSLHRYNKIAEQCLRVCKQDGIINFAHVHLDNSQPVPYFERGGTLVHGADYQNFFDERLKSSDRNAYILSETDIYLNSEAQNLTSEPNTLDYNGFIWLSSKASANRSEWQFSIKPTDCILTNPLMSLNEQGRLILNLNDDYATHLFERHPVLLTEYAKTIIKYKNTDLSHLFTSMINSAKSLYEHKFTEQQLLSLTHDKIIFPAPLSKAMVQAQAMHLNVKYDEECQARFY